MEIRTHHPLEDLNTFHLAARAEHYVRFDRLEEIPAYLASADLRQSPHLFFGGGSNLLFAGDVEGTVLHPVL